MKKHLTFILLMVLATITCKAQNERRLALVIGNAEYVGKGNTLRNPVNDANDVSNKLKTLGFDVTTALSLRWTMPSMLLAKRRRTTTWLCFIILAMGCNQEAKTIWFQWMPN